MKKRIIFHVATTIVFTISLLAFSCTNEKVEEPNGCDTSNVKYSTDIAPIVQSSCSNGCHNGNTPSAGFRLDSYAAIKVKVDQGRLYGAVAQLAGFSAMPVGGRLSDCNISKIKAWVDAGAPNN
ncbi:MAG: hypothetical protein KIPDCIKN_00082 [Haliscomenobacter sp.]|nr:hypothetical protein [Haliscomenobacter sp.]